MLSGIVRFAVHQRGLVIGAGLALVAYGAVRLSNAELDIFPEFAPPQVSIQTEAPGFAPDQVEVLVTKPIEDVINGVNGIMVVRSQSIQGLSVITAVLRPRTDVYRARQALSERLVEVVPRLPAGIPAPVISPLTSSSSTVLVAGLTSRTRDAIAQRTFADWTIKPRLLATPGVAKVAIFGGEVRQLQVQLDPVKLRAYAVSLDEVLEAARRSTGVRGAGVLDDANQRIIVRTEGQSATPEALGATVLRERGGSILRLRDVARIAVGAAPRFGEGAIDGERGLVIVISAQLGANTKVVGRAAEQALEALRPAIEAEGLELHPPIFRPSNFIDLALRNLTTSLLLGGVLVAVILLLFLSDLYAAAISLTAIPLSLLAATIVLELLGFSINTLTLGGLAIALGEVVDDAIIDVENIARRVRGNRRLAQPRPDAAVVVDASLEVRSSVVYATFVVALVFLPVATMTGVQGALFRPLALSYILATLASLLVALTVTPALTLLFIARRSLSAEEPALTRWLRGRYEALLLGLGRHTAMVLAATALLVLATLATLPYFGATFLPAFREGHYQIHMSAVPGTSLAETLRLSQQVTAALKADPRVRVVAPRIGRAELSEDTWGPHYAELEVDFAPMSGREAAHLEEDLRAALSRFPGVNFAIRGFLAERIEETLTGSTAEVVVKLFGDDLDSLDLAARRTLVAMSRVPGALDVQSDPPAVVPEATVRVRPELASAMGLRPDEILAAVQAATFGTTVAQTYEGNRASDVVVVLDSAHRARPEDLARLPLASSSGRLVSLGQVAGIARTSGRYAIAHEGARRVQVVTANVQGRDVRGFSDDVRDAVARGGMLPGGVYAEIGGTAAAQRAAQRELLVNSLLAAGGILALFWLAFGEWRRMALVLANLPFALVGGTLAVFASGAVLSLGSLVGFVTLFGIATRNAVMLVSHYDHLVRVEGAAWGRDTAVRGASERLGPILMTALVTALALLPLALGSGDPGREIEGPMAIVILGGLLTSTLLSLVVLPVLAVPVLRTRSGAPPT